VRAACVTERDRKGRAAKTNELCVRAPLGSLVTDENIFPFLDQQILEAIAPHQPALVLRLLICAELHVDLDGGLLGAWGMLGGLAWSARVGDRWAAAHAKFVRRSMTRRTRTAAQ
jgi:hypothetical protein